MRKSKKVFRSLKEIHWDDPETPKNPTIRRRRLVDSFLRTLKACPRTYFVTEDGGLRLRVHPSGTMTWDYRYTINGHDKTLSIGRYPGTSLQSARAKKSEWELVREEGKDPEHFSTTKCPTVSAALNDYLHKLRTSHIKDISYFEGAAEKLRMSFGHWRLTDFSRGHIKTYIEKLSDAYTSANKMLMLISGLFEHGLDHSYPGLFGNPASGIKRVPRSEDLPEMHRALEDWEIAFTLRYMLGKEEGGINEVSRSIMLMQLMHGYRHHEPAGIGVEEVDWEARIFTLPKERSKTRKPFPHFMTATAQARYQLHLPEGKGGRLFPQHYEMDRAWLKEELRKLKKGEKRKNKRRSSQKTIDSMRRAQDRQTNPYLPHHDSHSLRVTAKTRLAEMEAPAEIRALATNHSLRGIDGQHGAKYNKYGAPWAVAAAHVALERRYYKLAGLMPPAYPPELEQIFDRIIKNGFSVFWLQEQRISLEEVTRKAYQGWEQPPLYREAGKPVPVPASVLEEIEAVRAEAKLKNPEKPIITKGLLKGLRDWKELPDERLAELVWQMPVIKLADHFGVSHVAISNRCKKKGIETPDRGYWSKLRAGKIRPKNDPIERLGTFDDWKEISDEKLEELVWMVPVIKLSEVFGVSDVAIQRRCQRRGIKPPGRGYWAKVQAGKIAPGLHRTPERRNSPSPEERTLHAV